MCFYFELTIALRVVTLVWSSQVISLRYSLPLTGDFAESCQRLFYDNTIAPVISIKKDCSYIRIIAHISDFFIFFLVDGKNKKANVCASAFLFQGIIEPHHSCRRSFTLVQIAPTLSRVTS